MESKKIATISFHSGHWEDEPTGIISELQVTLTVNNEPWLTFMCTPIDLDALAVGFLFNEEIIETLEDIASVRTCTNNDNVDVWLNKAINKPDKWIRTSGCSGGTTSIDQKRKLLDGAFSRNGFVITPDKITRMMSQLMRSQDLYRKSGGVHTSALSDGEAILLVAEDIGRHNTLDKLAGRCLLEQVKSSDRIILTTGRISSEMIQKAGRMGTAMVISRTSPTSLSVMMAEAQGITLIGYARGDHFTIYSHAERVLLPVGTMKLSREVK